MNYVQYLIDEEEWDIINRVTDQYYRGKKIHTIEYKSSGDVIITVEDTDINVAT